MYTASIDFSSLDAEVIAHAVIVVKHLLISSHIEVALEPVQVAVLQLGFRLDEAAHFNGASWLDLLRDVLLWLIAGHLNFTVYQKFNILDRILSLTISGAKSERSSFDAINFANDSYKLSIHLSQFFAIDEGMWLLGHCIFDVRHLFVIFFALLL